MLGRQWEGIRNIVSIGGSKQNQMSNQTQTKRPGGDKGEGQEQTFVKVDPGSVEADELVDKIKAVTATKPSTKPKRRVCCCC